MINKQKKKHKTVKEEYFHDHVRRFVSMKQHHMLHLLVKSDMACIKIYHANFSLHKKGKKGAWKILRGNLNGGCCKGTTGEPEGVVK